MPGGKYRRVYVVRTPGPQGGHTVAGPERTRKEIPSGGLTKTKRGKK